MKISNTLMPKMIRKSTLNFCIKTMGGILVPSLTVGVTVGQSHRFENSPTGCEIENRAELASFPSFLVNSNNLATCRGFVSRF